MGFWERVKKDFQQAVKEGVDLLKEGTSSLSTEARRVARKGAATMTSEARRMTELGKLRYRVSRLNQKAHAYFTEIGGRVYDAAAKDPNAFKMDDRIEKLILDTQSVENQIKKLEDEIKRLSRGRKKSAA